MKTFFLFTILLLYVSSVQTQSAGGESLDKQIAMAKTDTAKIRLAIKKIGSLIETNLDSAILFGNKTIEAAKKINYNEGEAHARLKLATSYCFKGNYKATDENLRLAHKLLAPLKDTTGLGYVYSGYGMMYGMQSKYDSAIWYYEKAIKLAQLTGDRMLLNKAYQNIAISYQMQSNYPQALTYLQRALRFSDSMQDFNSMAYISMNMGLTYKSMGDTIRAERMLLNSVSLAQKAGVKNVELYAYSNLASLYETGLKFQRSYEYAIKAATLGGEVGDHGIKAASLSKAASSLAQQRRFVDAEELNRKAIIIADSSRQPLNIFQAYSTMGSILKLQGKYSEAIPYLEKAFNALKEADIYEEGVGQGYFDLSESYEKAGDFQNALAAYKLYAQIADSIRSRENVRKATELAMNYEFERKQQAAKTEQQKAAEYARTRQLVLTIGLAIMLVVAMVAFYAFRNKKKANAILKQQKEEIEKTLAELRVTQSQLIQSEKMASLGELTAGIAHEIQNPLNFVNNFSEVTIELAEDMKQELLSGNASDAIKISDDIQQNLEKIIHHGQRADAIVKGMLLHSRTSTGQKEPVDINAMVDEYLRLSYHGLRAKDKSFNAMLQTDFDKRLGKINIIPQDIGRVLLNLFNNAFYSVNEKKKIYNYEYEPVVTVSTKRMKDTVEICVKDNGLGIPQNAMNKIFQPFYTTKPTGVGTGLGLSISYDIITKEHGGELKVETREGEYAEFIIQLSLH
jgi:signal transduction histidine kinase